MYAAQLCHTGCFAILFVDFLAGNDGLTDLATVFSFVGGMNCSGGVKGVVIISDFISTQNSKMVAPNLKILKEHDVKVSVSANPFVWHAEMIFIQLTKYHVTFKISLNLVEYIL